MKMACICTTLFLVTAALAGPPVIDGNANFDTLYGVDSFGAPIPLVLQDTATGFGNNSLTTYDTANGSELDAAFGVVYNGYLYLVLAGNFETNGNKCEIFFDSVPGGQNQIMARNPDIDYQALQRMGPNPLDPNQPGLKFTSGFEADYYMTVSAYGFPVEIAASWAQMADPADPNDTGVAYFLGTGATKCDSENGELIPPDPNNPPPYAIYITIDNSNIAGVEGGPGLAFDSPEGVYTGMELAIPLSALGNPTGDISITAFINGQQHDFMSNQILGGFFGLAPNADGNGNAGEPRLVDLSTSFHMPFVVPNPPATPEGACCDGSVCSITTQAGCTGTYLGDNSNCEGNPCPAGTQVGGCCVDGVCTIKTAADCAAAGGLYAGNGTNCSGCCPQPGACCMDLDPNDPLNKTCTVVMEINCAGTFLGEFTTCDGDPCLEGACCDPNGVCYLARQEVCQTAGGLYLGDGSTCAGDPCSKGACCIGDVCFVLRQDDCNAYSGSYQGDATLCAPATCGTPSGLLVMDGSKDAGYGNAIVVQDTQTEFGNSNQGLVDNANGSELDAAYGKIVADRLYILLTGNLESNWNKLELFVDSRDGGQNTLANNPGGVANMNGLTFDADFAPDFWYSVTIGPGGSEQLYVDYAELYVDPNNPGESLYLGNGRAADLTLGGFLYPDIGNPGWGNPYNVLVTLDNSNVAGVLGGTALVAADPNDGENPADVLTGVEYCIPLAALGNPAGDIKVCAFVNGTNHDYSSNQWLGPLGGGGNLGGTWANINMANIAGNQYFVVGVGPTICRGDTNCDGQIDFGDINPFVDALLNHVYCDGTGDNADVSGNGTVGFDDINPFVELLTTNPLPIMCP